MGVNLRMNIPAGGGEEGRVIILSVLASRCWALCLQMISLSSLLLPSYYNTRLPPGIIFFHSPAPVNTHPQPLYITSSTASELGSTYSANSSKLSTFNHSTHPPWASPRTDPTVLMFPRWWPCLLVPSCHCTVHPALQAKHF